MTKRSITFEHLLYFLAFLLAAGLRFLNLGSAGLSELEAGWAMQALRVARGDAVATDVGSGLEVRRRARRLHLSEVR